MQQHYLTKSFNISTIIFCVLVLFVSSKELFFTELKFSKDSAFPAIGNIKDLNNMAKLKKYHHFSWNDASINGILNAKDLIFTHKNSEIELKLDNHSIKLYEETMIQLESHDQLEITNGHVEFSLSNSERPLKIILGNKTFILKSNKAKVKITQTQNKQASIAVTEGELSLTLPDTKEIVEIESEQTLTFADNRYQVSTSNLKCIFPINEKIITQQLNHSIKFSGTMTKIDKATIKIASDNDFTNIVHADNNFTGELNKSLIPGKYFWKLEIENLESAVHSFEIFFQTKNNLRVSPTSGHNEITYLDSTDIEFKWKKIYEKKDYILNVFNNKGQVVLSQNIRGTSYIWRTKKDGDFSWEIKPQTPYFLVNNNKPISFSITKENVTKKDALIIELTRPDQVVEFKWEKDKKATYSLFELSNDPNFNSVIVSKKLMRSKTKITFPKTGVFYWRSRGIDKRGNKVLNKPIKVIIKPTPPPTKPKKLPSLKLEVNSGRSKSMMDMILASAYADAGGKATLDWPALSDAKLYEIEIFSDKMFKNRIKKINVKSSKYIWNVPRTGKFYWRYRYQDFWGRFSPYSDPSELIITKKKVNKKVTKKKSKTQKFVIPNLTIKEKNPVKGKWSLYYCPSLMTYTQKNSNKYSIDGTTTNGLQANYLHRLQNYHHINFNAQTHSGFVYDEESFFYQNISGHYHYPILGGFLNAGVRFIRMPRYTLKNSNPIFKDALLSSLIDVGAKYLWHEINLLTQLNIGFGSGRYLEASASYEIYRKKAFSVKTKASLITSSLKDGEDQINAQQYQIAIGPEYLF